MTNFTNTVEVPLYLMYAIVIFISAVVGYIAHYLYDTRRKPTKLLNGFIYTQADKETRHNTYNSNPCIGEKGIENSSQNDSTNRTTGTSHKLTITHRTSSVGRLVKRIIPKPKEGSNHD